MSYTLGPGISSTELSGWLADAKKKYGSFDDGRIDYTNADIAPIIMCTLVCGDEFLLVKRGHGLADANGVWSVINGFIDEDKTPTEFAIQELQEETAVSVEASQVKVAESFTLKSDEEKRSYIVFACRVDVAEKPPIILDYENTEYKWIKRAELGEYETLDDLPYIIDQALELK